MNRVFFALVLLAVLAAAWEGTPPVSGEVVGNHVTVSVSKPVTVGSGAEIVAGGIRWPGRVVSVADGHVEVATMAPLGPAEVRLHDLQRMKLVGSAAVKGAESGVELAIGLAGLMTLFLGLMKVLEAAGGLDVLARVIRPVLVRLFPDVPADHPAMGAMVMNLSANILGLGNAATPFGIKAMEGLASLSRTPGVATDAMVLFLAINTSGVAVLPTTMMAARASLGARDPAAILVPTIVATAVNTVIAVGLARVLGRTVTGGTVAGAAGPTGVGADGSAPSPVAPADGAPGSTATAGGVRAATAAGVQASTATAADRQTPTAPAADGSGPSPASAAVDTSGPTATAGVQASSPGSAAADGPSPTATAAAAGGFQPTSPAAPPAGVQASSPTATAAGAPAATAADGRARSPAAAVGAQPPTATLADGSAPSPAAAPGGVQAPSSAATAHGALASHPVQATDPAPRPWTELLPALGAVGILGALVGIVARYGDLAGAWVLPLLILGLLSIGVARGVRVYEVFVEGAKEGFGTSLRILPYLVGILTVVGMFRASGAMDRLVAIVGPPLSHLGVPPEVLPLALLRPLSGSGSLGLATELTKEHGPDSLIALMAGTMYGSTETTFYVLAVYFGAVGVTRIRHALAVGLLAELVGVAMAVVVCRMLYG